MFKKSRLRKSLFTELVLIALAISVSLVDAIPSHSGIHMGIEAILCLLSWVAAIFCLVALWKSIHPPPPQPPQRSLTTAERALRWLALVAFILGMVCWAPIALLMIVSLDTTGGFWGRGELVATPSIQNRTLYIYQDGCFPPDSRCECSDYHSLVYVKNQYLPIMHLVARTDYYVDVHRVQLDNDTLTLVAEETCDRDLGKTLRTRL